MTTCECNENPWEWRPVIEIWIHVDGNTEYGREQCYCHACDCRLNADGSVTKMVPAPTEDVSVETWLAEPDETTPNRGERWNVQFWVEQFLAFEGFTPPGGTKRSQHD